MATKKELPFENLYHKRLVAEAAAQACYICYKATSVVLVTPDKKDFFYACAGHLLDRKFATPVTEQSLSTAEEREKRQKAELEKEIEKLKKEYEEKQLRKKEKQKEKEKEKDKEKDSDKDKKDEDEAISSKKKEIDEKEKELAEKKPAEVEEESRIFVLQKEFYNMRLNKIWRQEMARKNLERLKTPGLFPEVPKGGPV
ncbi:hypothetical protein RUND412_006632 [Rhizina undulata]